MPARPRLNEEPPWIRLWCVVVWILFGVEMIWGGFPDRPEGVAWLEDRGPLIPVGVGVVALVVLAAAQAKWGKSRSWERSNVGRLGLGGCPAWFGYAALGLAIVGAVLYGYAAFRSLGADGFVHFLQRKAAMLLLLGSTFFFELISYVSYRGRGDGQAGKDDEYAGTGDLESPSDVEPFSRGLGIAFTVLPLGAFTALALAAGRGGSLAVALAVLAVLFAAAQLLAWWNRGVGDSPSNAVLPSLQSCPPLFGYLMWGLTMVLTVYFLYVAFLAPNEDVGDSPHAVVRLAPLAVFLFGLICLQLLLPKLTFRRGSRD